jgi:alkanesulfonate monooxygenase SsuD/methylene tetrahydromethanopterin reductase-like flavin-dependent oxidoreductase (luciferase family)
MTFAAACTERLRLGCVVFVSTLYSPVHLARSLSALDQLSRGRIEIGVGTGGKARPFAAFGVDPQRYVARFSEGLALMKALWTEPLVTFDGELWQLRDEAMETKRFEKPSRRSGSARPLARARAVRVRQRIRQARSHTAAFADQVATVRQALADSGRPAESFQIAKRVYIALDENSGRARERINAALEGLYGRRMANLEAAAVAGTTADCLTELSAVIAAGAELILFTPLFDQAEHAERLAAEVIPQLG